MPAVDYDYDYDTYKNGRKVKNTASTKRATTSRSSSVSSSANSRNYYTTKPNTERVAYTKTRQSTREQVRMATYEKPKRPTSKKKNADLEIPSRSSSRNQIGKTAMQKKKDEKVENQQKPVEMKLKKPELSQSQKKKAREKAMNRVKNVIYLVIGFGVAFFICYRYSLIDEKFNDLEKIKKELSTAKTVNEQIQADIDSQTDLSYIENYAKYQLGMQKPSNSQIVYVNVEKEDRILTPVTIEEDSSKTWFEQLYEEIAKLFE